jgi:hypothetical protein
MNASISRAIIIALSAICLAAPASAEQKDTNHDDDLKYWSVTVPVVYSDGFWKQVEKPFVVACDGPSDETYTDSFTSIIRVTSREGEVLRERRIANPRINLPEEGRKEKPLADYLEMSLTVGLARGAEVVAFYEDEKKQEPSLEIEVIEEIAEAVKVAEEIRPGCQFNNPPIVPVGDSGKFVLAYAVEHAAKTSGMSRSELVAKLAEQGDDFTKNARREGILSPGALSLLESATVER